MCKFVRNVSHARVWNDNKESMHPREKMFFDDSIYESSRSRDTVENSVVPVSIPGDGCGRRCNRRIDNNN